MATGTVRPMILITGASGRVGRLLERRLGEEFPDRVVAATREELDLTDLDRLTLEIERLDPSPTVTINCAASTNPAMAELTPEAALLINREGPARLARTCREIGCRIIHLSTVDVFDGRTVASHPPIVRRIPRLPSRATQGADTWESWVWVARIRIT